MGMWDVQSMCASVRIVREGMWGMRVGEGSVLLEGLGVEGVCVWRGGIPIGVQTVTASVGMVLLLVQRNVGWEELGVWMVNASVMMDGDRGVGEVYHVMLCVGMVVLLGQRSVR